VNLFILYFQTSLGTFPIEREIFAKEYQNGLYGIVPYYLSKLMIELPLTALFPIVFVTIIYYAVNFENEAVNFFLFMLVSVLLSWIGSLMGILIGALVRDLTLAIEIAPLIFVPFLLYAGFTTNTDNILTGLKFIEYSSPIRYAFEFFITNEFENHEDQLGDVYPVQNLNFSIGKTNIIIILVSYIGILIILGIVALRITGTKLKN
jgi:ABC-type multidrug transport system permease subunit